MRGEAGGELSHNGFTSSASPQDRNKIKLHIYMIKSHIKTFFNTLHAR